ncbi:MAG: zf-HC2 domain-containing protein [Phycisphaerae bacterium]|nr:zf-HC2 domain-containing protein [Phycisphaerae bacterium]
MNCEDVLKQLKRFSSGRLTADVREAVQMHLAECGACRAALGRIDLVAASLALVQTPPVPSGFAARVMAVARRRRQVEPVPAWDLLRWWRLTSAPMHLAAAAVLAVGLAVGLMMGWTTAPSAGQMASAAQNDPLSTYQLDVLSEAPNGSLAGSFLTLVATTNEGGY